MRPSNLLRLALAGAALLSLGLLCWWSGADLALHPVLRLAAGPTVRPVTVLSGLGAPAVIGPVGLAAVALLLRRRRWAEAAWLFAAVALGRVLVEAIKLLVQRPRPPLADRLETVSSWSFPSAHSANSAITALLLAALVGRRWAWGAALACTGAIGWTRAALGVHWPGDVLAGWGLGLLWVAAALRVRPGTPR